MKLVELTTRTTLLLDKHWQPIAYINARAAIRHLITGRIKGVDANEQVVTWDGSDLDCYPSAVSTYSWKEGTVSLHADQPYIRSAPNAVTGEESKHFIPTIAICTNHFGIHGRKGENMTLRAIYSIYKGICQYCYEHISFHRATKDHVYPKHLGGSNHDFNLVLACRECNNAKDAAYPYLDINGKEPKPRRVINGFVVDMENMRPEWRKPLYIDDDPEQIINLTLE